MEKLTLINLLEKEIQEEIIHLEQTTTLNLEKEQERLRIYEELIKEIIKWMKFLFNLTEQTLKITHGDQVLVIPEEWQFSYFQSLGFYLDPDQLDHRIIFSVYREQIQIVYRVPQDDSVIYYKRKITRPTSEVLEIEFSEWDRIKKHV